MPWWPPGTWARMVEGVDCPMCADAHLETNEHSDLIAESETSFLRLHRNQCHAGYCVVILRRHVAEVHDLGAVEHDAFWRDVRRMSRAVALVLRPVKIDTLVMGHLCPHVHCHIYPQYHHDDPSALVDIGNGPRRLSGDERRDRLARLRHALDLAS